MQHDACVDDDSQVGHRNHHGYAGEMRRAHYHRHHQKHQPPPPPPPPLDREAWGMVGITGPSGRRQRCRFVGLAGCERPGGAESPSRVVTTVRVYFAFNAVERGEAVHTSKAAMSTTFE